MICLLYTSSDNVFVGTIYINEAKAAMESGAITLKQYELLAVAINTGTNLPSVATPNGQAAFLFLLTSALAPLIRLSYGRMVWMALPYTLVLTLVGLLCVESVSYTHLGAGRRMARITVGVSCGDNADSLFIARSIATAVAHTLARF